MREALYIYKVYLVVVLHQLDDDPQVVGVVLYRDDSHDVRLQTLNIKII